MTETKNALNQASRMNQSPAGRVSNLDKLVREITARGNDVEVRTCREGIKVLEITKRVAGVFPVSE